MKQQPDEFSDDTLDDAYRVAYLLAGYVRQSLTEVEKDELDDWVTASDQNMQLFVELTDEQRLVQNLEDFDRRTDNANWIEMQRRIAAGGPARRRPVSFGPWPYWAAACSLLLLLGYFSINLLFGPKKTTVGMTHTIASITDIAPGANRATLTLPDGKSYDLQKDGRSWLDTVLSRQHDRLQDGELIYNSGEAVGTQEYHVLSTPRGGQFRVTLPDGSRVWLNAASSLKYPLSFQGHERVVELTGEAYFEVTASKEKPFIVKLPDHALAQVVGTHFNINAYEDGTGKHVALLEGKLILHTPRTEVLMSPGQLGTVDAQGNINAASDDNITAWTAWKDGEFRFIDASIETVMHQVERWYDVEVEYERKPVHHFNATVTRNTSVSKLLHYLELTRQVKFRVEGRKIVVTGL